MSALPRPVEAPSLRTCIIEAYAAKWAASNALRGASEAESVAADEVAWQARQQLYDCLLEMGVTKNLADKIGELLP